MKSETSIFFNFVRFTALLITMFLLNLAISAKADTIFLKNGSVVENVKAWKEGDMIKWYQYGSLVSYDEDSIKKIDYSATANDENLGETKKKRSGKKERASRNKCNLNVSSIIASYLDISVVKDSFGRFEGVRVEGRNKSVFIRKEEFCYIVFSDYDKKKTITITEMIDKHRKEYRLGIMINNRGRIYGSISQGKKSCEFEAAIIGNRIEIIPRQEE